MIGQHQVNNLALALAALLELVPDAADSVHQLMRGLASVSLAGRLQQVSDHPRIYVDVGHNAPAAAAMLESFSEITEQDADLNCHCVIGMLADKDAAAVAQILAPAVCSWYCAGLGGERGQTGEELATQIRAGAVNAKVSSFADVDAALDAALEAVSSRERPASDWVLVFGSFLTAGQAISRWQSDQPGIGGEVPPHKELDTDRIPP